LHHHAAKDNAPGTRLSIRVAPSVALLVALIAFLWSPGWPDQAVAQPSAEKIAETINRDIQAWKLSSSSKGELRAAADTLEQDARKASRGPRPRGVSAREWAQIRDALRQIADGAAMSSRGATSQDQTRIDRGGHAITRGAQVLVNAIGDPEGLEEPGE
jgi:hypothetical protein